MFPAGVTLIVIPVCCLDTPRPHLLQLRRLQRGLGLPRGGPGVGAAGRRPPSRHARPLAGLRAAAVRPTPARAAHRNTALAGIPFTVHFLASASDFPRYISIGYLTYSSPRQQSVVL